MSIVTERIKTLSCYLLLSLALVLVGCVSTSTSTTKVDVQKAEETHTRLGFLYIQKRNRDAARKHFQKALELNKRSPGAHNGMAMLYRMDGDPKLAEEHFLKALSYDADFSQARNNYGSFLYKHQRYDEAQVQFERAAADVNYDQRDSALLNVGRTALKLNNKERARSAFEHALNLSPRMSVAMLELADLTFKEKDYSAAKNYLSRFEKLSKPTAGSLWLGIQIERIFGNKDKESSYALALKNLYPYSQELLAYKRSME